MEPPFIGANLEALVDYTHRQDITVQFVANLPRFGDYNHSKRQIRLLKGTPTARTISTLAHELGHAAHGDTNSTDFKEQRAWEYAARLLLKHRQVVEATRLYEHPTLIAHELGVTPEVVEAWRKYYERSRTHKAQANQEVPR